jgi:O-antigen/teichoic acid export membrane protein
MASSRWTTALRSLGTNGVLAVIGLVTGSFAARLLGPHGRGELASIQNVSILLGALALAGMPSALTYFSAKDRSATRSLYASALAIALCISAVLVLVGWLLLPWLLPQHGPRVVLFARIYLLFVPLYVLVSLPYSGLLGLGEIANWNILRLLPSLAWLSTLVLAWAFSLSSPTIVALMYLVAYALVSPVPTAVLLRKAQGGRMDLSRAGGRRLMRFGLPGALGAVPSLLNLRLDQILIAATLSASELGNYAAAVSWSGVLSPALSAFAPLLIPIVATQEIDDDQRFATAAKAARLGSGLSFVGGLAVLISAPYAIRILFGDRFAGAVMPSLILAAAAAFAGLNMLLEELVRGLGAPRWFLYAQIAALPITIFLLALLLPRYAAVGAAVASLAAYATATAVLVFGLRRITRRSIVALCVPTLSEMAAAWSALRAALRGR